MKTQKTSILVALLTLSLVHAKLAYAAAGPKVVEANQILNEVTPKLDDATFALVQSISQAVGFVMHDASSGRSLNPNVLAAEMNSIKSFAKAVVEDLNREPEAFSNPTLFSIKTTAEGMTHGLYGINQITAACELWVNGHYTASIPAHGVLAVTSTETKCYADYLLELATAYRLNPAFDPAAATRTLISCTQGQ